MESDLPHFYVGDALFLLFDDAMKYCDKEGLDYDLIERSKIYK